MRLRTVSLSLRIFLGYAVFVVLGGWFVVREAVHEVKPAVRQSTEETLVDTANLLAELLAQDVARGTLAESQWPRVVERYGQRDPGAAIWGLTKSAVSHQIYVVDRNGIVLLDSTGKDVGKDYSQWRDVYLTLRGRYGARTTRSVPGDDASTVMYVGAPIYEGSQIIGAVTVAKPNRTVQPFIVVAERHLLELGVVLIVAGLLLGAALSYWISHAIRRLTYYARKVSSGERAEIPHLPGGELSQLALALESMRAELDGQAYVERYVQTLTHELKSPLAAIRAAVEILHEDVPAGKRERFLQNIDTESERLLMLCDRMLTLARVEKRRALEEQRPFDVSQTLEEVLRRFEGRLAARNIDVDFEAPTGVTVEGEGFLVAQAISNILENAVDFAPAEGHIRIRVREQADAVEIRIWNEGEAIPPYALSRITERFYSLPRPATGRKSTGLGLSFVQEVVQLHGGRLAVENVEGGVQVELSLPKASSGGRQQSPHNPH